MEPIFVVECIDLMFKIHREMLVLRMGGETSMWVGGYTLIKIN